MTPAQNITRHFRGDWMGNQGAFPSPGHSASDRGMTVKDAEGGEVVFYSHNGGDWREVKDECRRQGLLPDRQRAPAGDTWRETGRYEYVTADGAVAYRTVRREKAGERKRFVAQQPDGRGGWAAGLDKDTRRILYRLPDVLSADPAAIVYLVEGERKADKLAEWGLVGTAIAFGAKGWRDSYAEALSGRTVVILPDNDDEGRGFADRAAKSIVAAGGAASTLALPGLPAKGDIIDWSSAGHSAEDLRALTDALLSPAAETFPIADLTAWAKVEPAPKAFVMAGVIPTEEVTLFTGPGGTNKSTFGLQLCAASAAGLPMLGVEVQPGPALYLTAEDEDRENHWRLRKIATATGTTLAALAGRLHVVSLRGRLSNELATFDNEGRLRVAPAFSLLRATIEATGSKLVVLDNLGHLFIGNENDRGQVTAFINLLYQLCREAGVTIVLIGHPNKAGDSYSGSTAWLNAVRSQIVLQRPEDGHDPDARVLSLGKANYARPDQQLTFRWHDFALVRDEDLTDDRRAELDAVIRASSDDAAFIACLRERTRQQRAVSEKTGRNLAPVVFEAMPESGRIGKIRLEAAMDRLFRTGRIERAELWKGPDRKPVFGLRECAGNAAGNGAETRCANAGNVSAETQETHTTPLKGGAGAAFRGLAPTLLTAERDPADDILGD